MDTIEVSQVCTLALNNLPIVGRLIWCLTEGKHIVKLEITWQLPRTQTSWQTNQHRSTAKQPADGVTGGVIKMADKMMEKKMAAPTRKMEDELNVGVCSTPSTPQHSMASSEGPSTHSSVDTTTDHSLEGEWKEVVSRKTKKKLSMSPPKPVSPVKTKKEDPNMSQGRKTPLPPPKKPRVRSPLKEQGREKLVAGDGRQYPLHEKYDLDEVVTDQQLNKTKYIIIRAYRQLREEEKYNVDLLAYLFASSGRPNDTWQRGPRPSTIMKPTTTISRSDSSGPIQLTMPSDGTTTWTTLVKVLIRLLRRSWR